MSGKLISTYRRELANRSVVNLQGSQSIFGTLGASANPIFSKYSFIPNGLNGEIFDIGGGETNSASWIGLDSKAMQFWAYLYCSPLAAVIDRLAEADTNGVIRFVDEDTKVPVKNYKKNPKLSRIYRLLKKPNPWQTWTEFNGERKVLCKIFGYCPTFAVGSDVIDTSYTRALININPVMITPNRDPEFSIYTSKSLIKDWSLNIMGENYTIPSKDIILFKDSFIGKTDGLGLPMSKVMGLDFFVSNICASMEADNVILKKKGPLGVFSFDPGKDMAGATPLDPTAKDELQKDLARYGLTIGQIQYVISKMPIKWNAMSFNLRDLMTKEVARAGIDGICDRFAYPAELMSGKNATYENRNSSEKFLYQNNVIPYSLRDMDTFNEFFQLEEVVLNKNFNHLPVLQEDIVKSGEAEKYLSDALEVEWLSNMITWNQWQTAKKRDTVPGMDIYYHEYLKLYPSSDNNSKTKNKKGNDSSSKDTGAKK